MRQFKFDFELAARKTSFVFNEFYRLKIQFFYRTDCVAFCDMSSGLQRGAIQQAFFADKRSDEFCCVTRN